MIQSRNLLRESLPDQSEITNLLSQGIISPGPSAALQKIESLFGQIPNRLGTNCPGIKFLRQTLSGIPTNSRYQYSNALILSAAHTHWGSAPIVYSYEAKKERYGVGPRQHEAPPYYAVGFAFSKSGPIAYEWADATCNLSLDDAQQVWDFVQKFNDAVVTSDQFQLPSPYGISLNFRFKQLFSPSKSSTHESPGDPPDLRSYIRRSEVAHSLDKTYFDQVGWSSSTPPELNKTEENLLEELERYIIYGVI